MSARPLNFDDDNPVFGADPIERMWLTRIGAAGAIGGALLAGIGNVLHPVIPRDDELGVADLIAASEA